MSVKYLCYGFLGLVSGATVINVVEQNISYNEKRMKIEQENYRYRQRDEQERFFTAEKYHDSQKIRENDLQMKKLENELEMENMNLNYKALVYSGGLILSIFGGLAYCIKG